MDLHLSKAFSTEQWKKQKEMEKDLGMEEVGAFDLPDIVVDDASVSGAVDSLNNGQRTIFDEVMKKIADGDSLPMFISGTGNDVLAHQKKQIRYLCSWDREELPHQSHPARND